MSPWSTLRKVSELGENYDRNIKEWKSHLEKSYDLETVVKSIQSANKEEFVTQVVTERSSGSGHAESTCGHIQRIDVGVLKEKVVVNLSGMFNEAAYCEVSKVLQDKLPNHVYEIALEKVKEEVQSVHGAAYQIIGDNVDMLIKVKHMSSTNQNNSIHWFNMNAVLNRVHGNLLSNEVPIMSILDVENCQFVPSGQDNLDFLHDLVPLVTRVVVTNIPAFHQHFKSAVVWHIPHVYSKVMMEQSKQVHYFFYNIHSFAEKLYYTFRFIQIYI